MKEYEVTITETLQRTVSVEADSKEAAERMVSDGWNNEDYVLDAEDFIDVDFKTTAEREIVPKEVLNVLLVQPGAYPKPVTIGTKLEDLQKAVGGTIEATYPFDDEVALVVNDEGKINGLPLNRALRTEDGDTYDIVAGDFLVVGLGEENFTSLTPEQMSHFEQMFHQPEVFIKMGRGIMALPMPDDMVKGVEHTAGKAMDARPKAQER